jgi:hypothetical protein
MFYMGIDLGKRRDHTAIAIVERQDSRMAYLAPACGRLLLRYAERVALGTPYPEVVERVRQMVRHENLQGQCAVAVDATGVGEPVVDMLRRGQLGCEVSAVNTNDDGKRRQAADGRG